MPEPITVALIALGAGLLGALFQSVLAGRFEKSKFVRDQRREAYEQFVSALAELSIYAGGGPEMLLAKAKLVTSRSRIALFGSKEVVSWAAHLFENSVSFECPLDQHRLYELLLAMRRDSVGHDDRGIKVELFALVFANAGNEGNEAD
jgi:hypothetical protein